MVDSSRKLDILLAVKVYTSPHNLNICFTLISFSLIGLVSWLSSVDLSSLTDDLSEVCLLHYAIGATNKNDDAVIVKHKLGDFIVSFSHYERTLTYGP